MQHIYGIPAVKGGAVGYDARVTAFHNQPVRFGPSENVMGKH